MARRLSRPALEQRAATLGPRPRGDPRNGGRVCGGGGGESKDGIVYTPTARRGLVHAQVILVAGHTPRRESEMLRNGPGEFSLRLCRTLAVLELLSPTSDCRE